LLERFGDEIDITLNEFLCVIPDGFGRVSYLKLALTLHGGHEDALSIDVLDFAVVFLQVFFQFFGLGISTGINEVINKGEHSWWRGRHNLLATITRAVLRVINQHDDVVHVSNEFDLVRPRSQSLSPKV
jgi:hypothetical protein